MILWFYANFCSEAIPRSRGILLRPLGISKMPENQAKYKFAKYIVAKIWPCWWVCGVGCGCVMGCSWWRYAFFTLKIGLLLNPYLVKFRKGPGLPTRAQIRSAFSLFTAGPILAWAHLRSTRLCHLNFRIYWEKQALIIPNQIQALMSGPDEQELLQIICRACSELSFNIEPDFPAEARSTSWIFAYLSGFVKASSGFGPWKQALGLGASVGSGSCLIYWRSDSGLSLSLGLEQERT